AGIDRAFHKYELDCGPVYRVCRHGQVKKCFTRKTAIIHLAHFMTTKVFESSGFEKRLPDQCLMHPEYGEVFHPGEITPEYYRAHGRCFHRLLRILARRKQFDAWMEKYNAWIDQYCRLVAQRPFKKRANHDCN
ncbi:TPA: hypothetical protein ACHK0U_005469, partial [Escherichia coli]|nr:hypothetical protein [Escherichia coli]EJQ6102103.1 hypothetical protein [Escherichia coli]EKH7543883.1 hypothetical protein [Escherichia coli]